MNITIGWWAVPTLVTIGLFGWAFVIEPKHLGDYGFDFAPLFRLAGAAIGSLASWLVYVLALLWLS